MASKIGGVHAGAVGILPAPGPEQAVSGVFEWAGLPAHSKGARPDVARIGQYLLAGSRRDQRVAENINNLIGKPGIIT